MRGCHDGLDNVRWFLSPPEARFGVQQNLTVRKSKDVFALSASDSIRRTLAGRRATLASFFPGLGNFDRAVAQCEGGS